MIIGATVENHIVQFCVSGVLDCTVRDLFTNLMEECLMPPRQPQEFYAKLEEFDAKLWLASMA